MAAEEKKIKIMSPGEKMKKMKEKGGKSHKKREKGLKNATFWVINSKISRGNSKCTIYITVLFS